MLFLWSQCTSAFQSKLNLLAVTQLWTCEETGCYSLSNFNGCIRKTLCTFASCFYTYRVIHSTHRLGTGRTEKNTTDVEGGRKEGSVDECTRILSIFCCLQSISLVNRVLKVVTYHSLSCEAPLQSLHLHVCQCEPVFCWNMLRPAGSLCFGVPLQSNPAWPTRQL